YAFIKKVSEAYKENSKTFYGPHEVPKIEADVIDSRHARSTILSRAKNLRDDYKECCDLLLNVIFGGRITLRKPETVSKARRMSSILYSTKSYILGINRSSLMK
ncbi:hypothetical protein A3Q56_03860, partial [Intoshia linei]